eukprot:1846149-Amphidinium_carterae.1
MAGRLGSMLRHRFRFRRFNSLRYFETSVEQHSMGSHRWRFTSHPGCLAVARKDIQQTLQRRSINGHSRLEEWYCSSDDAEAQKCFEMC